MLKFAPKKRSTILFKLLSHMPEFISHSGLAERTSCKILETRPSYQVYGASDRPTKHEKLMHLKKTFVISVAQKGAKCFAAAVNFTFLSS